MYLHTLGNMEEEIGISRKYMYLHTLGNTEEEIRTSCKYMISKTCLQRPLKNTKFVFNTDYRLMQVNSIAECFKGSILQYF